jgi:thioredoxin-dependent peroxiredoxin
MSMRITVVSLVLALQGCNASASANHRSEVIEQQTSKALPIGAQMPAVTLSLQDGFEFPLAALTGKLIAVYFCAADDDPACVREAHGLRDHWHELHENHHVAMFGISSRDAATRRAYVAEHKIEFDLAQDADGSIARAFGVPTHGPFAPHTFLIGRDGKVQRVWQTADPEAHAAEILALALD